MWCSRVFGCGISCPTTTRMMSTPFLCPLSIVMVGTYFSLPSSFPVLMVSEKSMLCPFHKQIKEFLLAFFFLCRPFGLPLETVINMVRASALWRIAGNIYETALFPAFWAHIWRVCRGYGETAMGTFPIRQAALRTDIPLESTVGCVTTVCTYPSILFALHATRLQLRRKFI